VREAVDRMALVVTRGAGCTEYRSRLFGSFVSFSTGFRFGWQGSFLLNDVRMHDTIGFLLVYNATIYHQVPVCEYFSPGEIICSVLAEEERLPTPLPDKIYTAQLLCMLLVGFQR